MASLATPTAEEFAGILEKCLDLRVLAIFVCLFIGWLVWFGLFYQYNLFSFTNLSHLSDVLPM